MLCPSCGHANVPGADECARCLFALASIDNEPTGIDAIEASVLQDRVRTLKFKTPVTVPVHPKLREIINATPMVGLTTFLVTHFGKPYSAAGFGNWFRDLAN